MRNICPLVKKKHFNFYLRGEGREGKSQSCSLLRGSGGDSDKGREEI